MMSEADVRCDESESFGNTNLIIPQGVANIFHQTIELLHVHRVVEEICEVILGHNWVHSLANLFQPPGDSCTSDWALDLESIAHRASLFSLSFSLTSPGGMGSRSDSETILTCGANDSMARRFTCVC